MFVDGNAIAEVLKQKIAKRVSAIGVSPVLGIVIVGNNPVTESFVRIKKRVAAEIGVVVKEFHFSETINTEELCKSVAALSSDPLVDGVVIQLPLPRDIVAQSVLNAVPLEKDIDMLSHEASAEFRKGTANILPPVAGAIQEILEHHRIGVAGKDVLILGHGRLVGAPAALLMRHNHAHVTVIDKEVAHLAELSHEADIIISGVGQPGILQPEMLKHGVVLIDAGTSEDGGKIVGDANPRCAEVASLYTPVPGGVGPITVSMIFKNVSIVVEHRMRRATMGGSQSMLR